MRIYLISKAYGERIKQARSLFFPRRSLGRCTVEGEGGCEDFVESNTVETLIKLGLELCERFPVTHATGLGILEIDSIVSDPYGHLQLPLRIVCSVAELL